MSWGQQQQAEEKQLTELCNDCVRPVVNEQTFASALQKRFELEPDLWAF